MLKNVKINEMEVYLRNTLPHGFICTEIKHT